MSVLSRLRGRRHHQQLSTTRLDGHHPLICRCKGRGVLPDMEECPMIWVSREAPAPRWLIGRVPRGSQR